MISVRLQLLRVSIFCCSCLSSLSTQSQTEPSPRLLKEYAPAVSVRVCQKMAKQIVYSERIQLWLADQYIWQDSILYSTVLLDQRLTGAKLNRVRDSTDWIIEYRLKSQLEGKDRDNYLKATENDRPFAIPVFSGQVYMDADMDSQFGKAIQMRTQLNLSDSQYISLLVSSQELKRKIEYAKANPDSGYFDRPAFESEKVSRILNEKQYTDMLVGLNKDDCVLKAKYSWFDIKTSGLAKKYNPDTTLMKLTMYYLLRDHINIRYANEKERRSQMLSVLKTPEPLVELQESKVAIRKKLSKYAW